MRIRLNMCLVAAVLIAGCNDTLTNSMSSNNETLSSSNHTKADLIAGKKGDKGNGGKPDKGGNKTGDVPTYSNVTVTPGGNEVAGWDAAAVFPGVDVWDAGGITSNSEFYGCPRPETEFPCYAITVTLDSATDSDLVAIEIHPFEEDVYCDGPCPNDITLEDNARRSLTLFSDYLGTPYVPASAFDANNQFTFYWQGQRVERHYNRTLGQQVTYAFFHTEQDADTDGDLLRAEAIFDSSNSTSSTEYQICASANPTATDNSDCTFRVIDSGPADHEMRVEFEGVINHTKGNGNKFSHSEIEVSHWLDSKNISNPDGGGDLWVTYLLDNILAGGTRMRSTQANELLTFRSNASEGCLLVRAMQTELTRVDSNTEHDASFSADNNGFTKIFRVGPDGQLLPDDGTCTAQY